MSADAFKARAAVDASAIQAALDEALQAMPESCRPVAAHILGAGGKRLRPQLVMIFASMFGLADDSPARLGGAMELLHAATLLHDDVLDTADARRGKAAAHLVFGNSRAILAGDAMLACGNAVVASFGRPDLSLIYSRAIMDTMAGEIREMDAAHNPHLSHEGYLEIARGKTACLIAQACALGAAAADAPENMTLICRAFGENLGLAFQIIDDALDFAPAVATGKPAGGDLREGKMTPPIRLYRESLDDAETEKFDAAFKAGAFTDAEVARLLLSAAPFLDPARELAEPFLDRARGCLRDLPKCPENEILAQIVDYVGKRSR